MFLLACSRTITIGRAVDRNEINDDKCKHNGKRTKEWPINREKAGMGISVLKGELIKARHYASRDRQMAIISSPSLLRDLLLHESPLSLRSPSIPGTIARAQSAPHPSDLPEPIRPS